MPGMASKPKPPKRAKIKCQYAQEQWNPVRRIHIVEGEFPCPSCSSVLRRGYVFHCDFCSADFGSCCKEFHPDHRNDSDYGYRLGDYLSATSCDGEGEVRCECCERMLCIEHVRKADLSRLALIDRSGEPLGAAVLCPSCKKLLNPDPESEPDDEEGDFGDEYELQDFLQEIGRDR